MVKKLGAMPKAVCSTTMLRKRCATIASVDDIRPHRFRYEFGTSITRKGLDPLYGKKLMGIKSDKVYERYTKERSLQSVAKAPLTGDWRRWERRLVLFVKQSACKS